MIFNDATMRQIQAADPASSTWLSANAGSGKTRVLTDRVARLLLHDVAPQNVLCLTYTKAAASEMQNRLFKRLGKWATLPDDKLREELAQLGEPETDLGAEVLRKARRLFARAIETPGGLKVQTIHSFCASLLRRFPLEAGVPPGFTEIDDRTRAQLMREVLDGVATGHRDIYRAMVRQIGGNDINALCAALSTHRAALPEEPGRAHAMALFELPEDADADTLLAELDDPALRRLFADCAEVLAGQSKTQQELGRSLRDCAELTLPRRARYDLLIAAFFTATGTPRKTLLTKPSLAALADTADDLLEVTEDLTRLRATLTALKAAEKTLVLHRFAAVWLPAFRQAKGARGWLDFDDLIEKSRDLLVRPGIAEWVLFKLDGGIDHILVDEAQDTSPLQWQVIDLLAGEFTAGEGTRGARERTIFVVGDKKQSIYSFQGADPDGFDRMRASFSERLAQVQAALVELQLEYSFRSATPVLRAVDGVFAQSDGLGEVSGHLAFHGDMPGRVDLWPLIEPMDATPEGHWTDPVDAVSETHETVRLAQAIAAEIARMKREETLQHDGARRPVSEGDVLILVQRRSELFHEIIRALKTAGLQVAGADRLKIGGELAVRDLLSLLHFLATPEDSLALAEVLRSPLLGWSEDRLYRTAYGRGKRYLWAVLRERGDADTVPMLQDLLGNTDFRRPYELLHRVLLRHDGRRRLTARLGAEATDGIDALLSQALAYEQTQIPSLTGFLDWIDSTETEIKRQPDSAGDRIRVMTVHGAKGLEAPIVFLPDSADRRAMLRGTVIGDDQAVLPLLSGGDAPPRIEALKNAQLAAQEAERERLLYVAMTRAEQWLIVCAAGKVSDDSPAWHAKVEAGLLAENAASHDFAIGAGLRLQPIAWPDLPPAPATGNRTIAPPPVTLPDWIDTHVEPPDRPAAALSPSDLGGAKALYGSVPGTEFVDEATALRLGTVLHLLLEHLAGVAPADRRRLAPMIVTNSRETVTDAELSLLLAEAEQVLDAPALRPLFAEDALAEVEITAILPDLGHARVHGTIDRLIVTPERVLAVDFKSNRVIPERAEDVPEGLLRQMGAYAAALTQIYPDRTVDIGLLWTRNASLMEVPCDLAMAAMRRAAP
ncbi:MAG: double-strand break repair helicase AddA [Celeribacter sp.]|jgi:ATP-dependent helicase/nuclease subunit A